MITLFHAPQSRSSRIVQLLDALGALEKVTVKTVSVARHDGSGEADPANPHPEGKVPLLVHDGVVIRESTAIALYLTDLFPETGFGPAVGDAKRGEYLAWLAWYTGVLEPLIHFDMLGIDHPGLTATYRTMDTAAATLDAALAKRPYLLGDNFSAADVICASTFVWLPSATPDVASIKDWVARCQAQPTAQRLNALETTFA